MALCVASIQCGIFSSLRAIISKELLLTYSSDQICSGLMFRHSVRMRLGTPDVDDTLFCPQGRSCPAFFCLSLPSGFSAAASRSQVSSLKDLKIN